MEDGRVAASDLHASLPALSFNGANLTVLSFDRSEGVPEAPLIGRVLNEVLRMKVDGRVSGREDELRAALQLVREWE